MFKKVSRGEGKNPESNCSHTFDVEFSHKINIYDIVHIVKFLRNYEVIKRKINCIFKILVYNFLRIKVVKKKKKTVTLLHTGNIVIYFLYKFDVYDKTIEFCPVLSDYFDENFRIV